MATANSVLMEFVSQNSITLIAALLTTVFIIAVSTYFMFSNVAGTAAYSADRQEERRNYVATTHSSASESDSEPLAESKDESDADEIGNCTQKQLSIDPVYYCEHIQGEIKKVQQEVTARKICENLSAEQIAEERQRQQAQLAEIYSLMQGQKERFGIGSMEEMQEQMRLYANI